MKKTLVFAFAMFLSSAVMAESVGIASGQTGGTNHPMIENIVKVCSKPAATINNVVTLNSRASKIGAGRFRTLGWGVTAPCSTGCAVGLTRPSGAIGVLVVTLTGRLRLSRKRVATTRSMNPCQQTSCGALPSQSANGCGQHSPPLNSGPYRAAGGAGRAHRFGPPCCLWRSKCALWGILCGP